MARPVTLQVVPMVLQVAPPGWAVTVYPVIGDPPSDPGGVQLRLACWLDVAADKPVGAPGVVRGVTPLEGIEGEPVPTPFVAVTVNA